MSKLEYNEWKNTSSSKKKTRSLIIKRSIYKEIEKIITKTISRNNSNAIEI